MQIKVSDKDAVKVISIVGRFDASNAPNLKNTFRDLTAQDKNFVMDLAGMEYIDSTGLGSIVSCLKSATEKGGDVKLACLQAKPRMIFEITRAYKIFDIFDDLDTAVKSFAAV